MNLCEALESGKRYNRAVKRCGNWPLRDYVYVTNNGALILHSDKAQADIPFFPRGEDMDLNADWILTSDAPYNGPQGILTRERATELAAQCWCTPTTEKVAMIPELCEVFVNVLMTVNNNTVAFVETEPNTFQGRVVKEKHDLDMKRNKLAVFCGTQTFRDLPEEEKSRLTRQATIMMEYSDVLQKRIEAFPPLEESNA